MKKTIKKIIRQINALGMSLFSLVSSMVFSKYNTKKYFSSVLKDSHEFNEIFILGNGSSLNTFLETHKENMPEHVMVVNYFATTPQFRELKPKHYIMLDNNLCIKADEGNAIEQQKLIKALLEIDWNINLYTPADSDPNLIIEFRKNKRINLILYNRTPIDGIRCFSHFLYDLRLGMPRPQNVSNAAVFCAIAAGFNRIYLYGIEHSWTKSFDVDLETHRIFLNDGHFYEQENKRFLPINDYSKWLLWIHYALESHLRLREYADRIGVEIFNMTEQSFVEAYKYND